MKPLITSVESLKELATGVPLSAVATSNSLFLWEGEKADYLLTQRDALDGQRIVVIRDDYGTNSVLPDYLNPHWSAILSRMASFAERAQAAKKITLPYGWYQYKHNNLIAFSAIHGFSSSHLRWITETLTGSRCDVIFWEMTTDRLKLQDFEVDKPQSPIHDDEWSKAIELKSRHFEDARSGQSSDVEIALPELEQTTTKGRGYFEWMDTISQDQRDFVQSSSDKSIRLRGPAGSGKTLALTLKAVHDLLDAREAGKEVRILVVTHSWSLATEISDSKDSLGLGDLPEIDVFPLLEIAEAISPGSSGDDSYKLMGTDSFSGKQAQLSEISDLLDEFLDGDWITFRTGVTPSLQNRFDSIDPQERQALAWDLLIEFGSVIGAAAIFPGAGAESRYASLERAAWMLPLTSREDCRVVFELYSRYMQSLDSRGLLTGDQVLADLLNDLQKHSWNRARKADGYDLIFVDEFHLFNPLERQVLHHLSRDVASYPRIFMAFDPRQSASEVFIGPASDDTRSSAVSDVEGDLGEVTNLELTRVHRYTPQILKLVKHIHLEFPTYDLGSDWSIDFSLIESARKDGAVPRLVSSATSGGEEADIIRAVHEYYQTGRMALAVVDTRQWRRFNNLATVLGNHSKFHVSTISGRSDIEGLGYRKRGLVIGLAEYLAGLQFETVLVAGIPDLSSGSRTPGEMTRLLSLLYLAVSRAENEVRLFVNDDDGGVPDVLQRAATKGLIINQKGSVT